MSSHDECRREASLPVASRIADEALAAQRDRHEPDADSERDEELDDEGVGALVVNTGLDGDAASG